MEMDKLHSAESAAKLLDVAPATIRWWWTTKKRPRIKIGRLSRVPESALWNMLRREGK